MRVYIVIMYYSDWDQFESENIKVFTDYLTAHKYLGRISELWEKANKFYQKAEKRKRLGDSRYYYRRREKFKHEFTIQEIETT